MISGCPETAEREGAVKAIASVPLNEADAMYHQCMHARSEIKVWMCYATWVTLQDLEIEGVSHVIDHNAGLLVSDAGAVSPCWTVGWFLMLHKFSGFRMQIHKRSTV